MDPRRDQAERKLNRLAAAQLVSTAIVLLIIAITAVLQNAQVRRATDRLDKRLDHLARRITALEAGWATPSIPRPANNPPAPEAAPVGWAPPTNPVPVNDPPARKAAPPTATPVSGTAPSPPDPAYRESLDALGLGLLKDHKAAEALGPLRRSAELDPADAAAQDHVGLALLALLKPAEAAAAFEHAIRLDGQNAIYWYHLGAARINADDCSAALSALDAAIQHDAKFARAHLARALCLARGGDDDGAAKVLAQALGLDGSLLGEAQQVEAFQKLLTADGRPAGPETPLP